MYPINFEGANVNLHKPEEMTDEQCLSMPVQKGVDNDGFNYFLSVWMPNKEDIEALQAGRPLIMKIVGEFHPPVCLFTVDEDGTANV